MASHDPGKIVLDLAVTLALGGDCLADIAQLRNHPEVFGRVASDPTVSRLVTDHITVIKDALDQLPSDPGYRVGRKVLIRTDGAGGTHALVEYLTKRHLGYSVGFSLTDAMAGKIALIPKDVPIPTGCG